MSIQSVCDSCGAPGPTEERGLVKKLDYCPKCAARIDAFLGERDALHTDVAKMWEQGLASLRSTFSDMVLPDE